MSRIGIAVALICLVASASGCGSSDGNPEDADSVALPELSLDAALDDVQDTELGSAELSLNLERGLRVPLKKTVSQRLMQGNSVSHSRLELWMSIQVVDIVDNRHKLSVQYLAATYTHDIGGQTVLYDSRAQGSPIPREARLYSGLVNNGFSFWLNDRNEITELDGFDHFLYRCVQGIPEQERQSALAELAAQVGEAEIANFVDDSIGLLPYGVTKQGATWTRTRRALQPLPMELELKCTLAELSGDSAEIDLVGYVHPTANERLKSNQTDGPRFRVDVKSGQSYGHCQIRRSTGLPISSEVKLMLDLVVHVPGALPVEQKKEIVTRIELFQPSSQTLSISGRNPAESPAASSASAAY